MSLRAAEIKVLGDAIRQQAFPLGYFCFDSATAKTAADRPELQQLIATRLKSADPACVRDGLANVLYWSYHGQSGRQKGKVEKFRSSVTPQQLQAFQMAVAEGADARRILEAGLPEFASLVPVSRVLAFLDPQRFCVIELPLCRLGKAGGSKALDRIRHTSSIALTRSNLAAYLDWCAECRQIASSRFPDAGPGDVARGFATLLQSQHELIAQAIYQNA